MLLSGNTFVNLLSFCKRVALLVFPKGVSIALVLGVNCKKVVKPEAVEGLREYGLAVILVDGSSGF